MNCTFKNTLKALKECSKHMTEEETDKLSSTETKALQQMLLLVKKIYTENEEVIDEMEYMKFKLEE